MAFDQTADIRDGSSGEHVSLALYPGFSGTPGRGGSSHRTQRLEALLQYVLYLSELLCVCKVVNSDGQEDIEESV